MEVQTQGVSVDGLLPEARRETPSRLFQLPVVLGNPGVSWFEDASLPSLRPSSRGILPCVCVLSSLSLIGTLITGLTAHAKSREISS